MYIISTFPASFLCSPLYNLSLLYCSLFLFYLVVLFFHPHPLIFFFQSFVFSLYVCISLLIEGIPKPFPSSFLPSLLSFFVSRSLFPYYFLSTSSSSLFSSIYSFLPSASLYLLSFSLLAFILSLYFHSLSLSSLLHSLIFCFFLSFLLSLSLG